MRAAVYTTLYPAVLRYAEDLFASLAAQSTVEYGLLIGLHDISAVSVQLPESLKGRTEFIQVHAEATPADVRNTCWQAIIELGISQLVFVDADDFCRCDRVRRAVAALGRCDVDACALELVDADLRTLSLTICPGAAGRPADYLLHANDFGLSNTAYRAEVLAAVLPIPGDIIAVDWYMAILASELGFRLRARPDVDVLYRQHPGNNLRLLAPFDGSAIEHQTTIVINLLGAVASALRARGKAPDRYLNRLDEVQRFQSGIVADPVRLAAYIARLNVSKLEPMWWNSVANPRVIGEI